MRRVSAGTPEAAGAVVADALAATTAAARPGVRLTDLDQIARDIITAAGATSPFLGYQPGLTTTPFPGVICTSVNDVVLHGIPDGYRLHDGDLLSIDCGAVLDGWAADAATSLSVGAGRPADQQLIATARTALAAGIAAAQVDAKIGDISAAIAAVGRAAGCGINTVAITSGGPQILTARVNGSGQHADDVHGQRCPVYRQPAHQPLGPDITAHSTCGNFG